MINLRGQWKYIKRHLFSSIIVILTTSLALSLAFSLNIVGSTFIHTQSRTMLSDKYSPSDLLIQTGKDVYLSVSDLNAIRQEEGVERVEGNLIIQGSALFKKEVTHTALIGVPNNTSIMTMDQIEPIVWDQFEGNQTLIDSFMAEELEIEVGTQITIYSEEGLLNICVVGFGKAPWSWSFAQPRYLQFLIPLKTLENYLNIENEFNYVKIRLDTSISRSTLLTNINNLLEERGYENFFITKNQVQFDYSIMPTIFSILAIPSFLIAASLIGVVTRYQIAKEAKLIGTKKAIGYTPKQILIEYLTRGILYFLIAIPIAIVISSGISFILIKLFIEEFYPEVLLQISIEQLLTHLTILLFLVIVFSFLAARKAAAQISVIDVLRFGMERPKNPSNFLIYSISWLPLFLLLGLRNLLRNPSRFIFLLLGLVISGGASLSIISIANSFQTTITQGFNDSTQWDFQITYQTSFNEELADSISRNLENIEKSSPILQFYVDNENFSLNVAGSEIDVSSANAPILTGVALDNSLIKTQLTEGDGLSSEKKGVIVSYKLASRFHFKTGQKLVLRGNAILASGNKTYLNLETTIIGIGNIVSQNGWAFIFEVRQLAEFINSDEHDLFNTLLVRVDSETRNDQQEEKVLKEVLEETMDYTPNSIVLKKNASMSLTNLISTFQELAFGISFMVFLVILLSVVNIFSLSVLERRWEFCLYQSIGMTRKDIFKVLLYEVLILALFSFILSVLMGYLLGSVLASFINSSPIGVWVIHQITILEILSLGLVFFIGLPFVVIMFSLKETQKKPIHQLKEMK